MHTVETLISLHVWLAAIQAEAASTFQLLCSANDGKKGKSSQPDFRHVRPAPAASNSEGRPGQEQEQVQVQVHDRPSPSTHSSRLCVMVFNGIVEKGDERPDKNDR